MNREKSFIAAVLTAIVAIAASVTGCNSTSSIGTEIVTDSVSVTIDSTFTVTGYTVSDSVVLSRTIEQMVGVVQAPGFGSISSSIVTQFMPSAKIDTTGIPVENIDSLHLVFRTVRSAAVGDYYAPTGIEVYPLTRQLSTPIYSDFNPEGYYNPANLIGSTIFNLSGIGQPDSLLSQGVFEIRVPLPVELGRSLYASYRKNPADFADPAKFAKIFPGLYIKNSYGSGRITRMTRTSMQMFYHRTTRIDSLKRDTTIYMSNNYFAVTPEIISNNSIKLNIEKSVRDMIANGEQILLTPAGTSLKLRFPTPEILASYRAGIDKGIGVINSLSLSIPAEEIENEYNIAPPPYLLLILTKDKQSFFAQNKLTDDKTSFTAIYDSTTGSYDFSGLREYIVDCLKKDTLTEDDYMFDLVPVTIQTETDTDPYYGQTQVYTTGIIPYVTEPKMARILLDKAKIKLIYSKQTINF